MKGALGGPQRIMGKILVKSMWHGFATCDLRPAAGAFYGFATCGQRPAACVKDLKKILDISFTQ